MPASKTPDSAGLQNSLDRFIDNDRGNKLPNGEQIFNHPLIGFASAEDPIFGEFRNEAVIGPLFRPPCSWFSEAVTVISYFLPFSEYIRRSNYDNLQTSQEWLHGRFLGEKFNQAVSRFLVSELENSGGKAVVPALEPEYCADYQAFSSNWSERHIAYAAGLGSFGLSRGLITEKGLAGRFGSIITDLRFKASPRKAGNPFQNCPFFADKSCGVCIDRCPSGAIQAHGKDKSACNRYTRIEDHLREMRLRYGYEHSVCGKCQVNVPCEDCIPG